MDSSEAAVATMVAGGGIGISASVVVALQIARGDLVPLTDLAVERDTITALSPSRRRTNPAVLASLDHLREAADRVIAASPVT